MSIFENFKDFDEAITRVTATLNEFDKVVRGTMEKMNTGESTPETAKEKVADAEPVEETPVAVKKKATRKRRAKKVEQPEPEVVEEKASDPTALSVVKDETPESEQPTQVVGGEIMDSVANDAYHTLRVTVQNIVAQIGDGSEIQAIMINDYGVERLSALGAEHYDSFMTKVNDLVATKTTPPADMLG